MLILGDVLNNMDVLTGDPGPARAQDLLHARPGDATARRSRRLGELEPALVCFGHGAPLRDTRKFAEFCASLAA